jgi:hypothetical protein
MNGEITVREVSPELILVTLKGHLTAAIAGELKSQIDPILARGKRPHLFIDAEEANSLDTRFRTVLTPWHKAITSLVATQRILLKSKILQMAFSVANMAIGDVLETYNKRQEFEAAMASARTRV